MADSVQPVQPAADRYSTAYAIAWEIVKHKGKIGGTPEETAKVVHEAANIIVAGSK